MHCPCALTTEEPLPPFQFAFPTIELEQFRRLPFTSTSSAHANSLHTKLRKAAESPTAAACQPCTLQSDWCSKVRSGTIPSRSDRLEPYRERVGFSNFRAVPFLRLVLFLFSTLRSSLGQVLSSSRICLLFPCIVFRWQETRLLTLLLEFRCAPGPFISCEITRHERRKR